MQWTMPPRVLQIVAGLLGLAAAASFAMGLLSAPQRSARLPGEKVPGAAAAVAAVIDATDATPLSDERIQGPPPPAANAEDKDDEPATEAAAGDAGETADNTMAGVALAAPPKAVTVKPPAPAGNAQPAQTLGGPPAPDEPPH